MLKVNIFDEETGHSLDVKIEGKLTDSREDLLAKACLAAKKKVAAFDIIPEELHEWILITDNLSTDLISAAKATERRIVLEWDNGGFSCISSAPIGFIFRKGEAAGVMAVVPNLPG